MCAFKFNLYRYIAVPPAIVIFCSLVYLYAEVSRRRHSASASSSRSSSLPSSMVDDGRGGVIFVKADSTTDVLAHPVVSGYAERCEDLKRRCIRNAVWLMVLAYSGVGSHTSPIQ
jgi:hypothetical protein